RERVIGMKPPQRDERSSALSSKRAKKPVEPSFLALPHLPESPAELFRALASKANTTVLQPDPKGDKPDRKQEYVVPWAGFKSWPDARERLKHFEARFPGRIVWAPFNDSTTNDGPMSLNAYPGRAFIERVTNEGDAVIEGMALGRAGPMPRSPSEAAALW